MRRRSPTDARLGRTIRFLRNDGGGGTVLDTGTVVGVAINARYDSRDRLTVQTGDGGEHTVLDHPDFVLWD